MEWLTSGKKQLFFSRKNTKVAGGTLTLQKRGSIIIMLDGKMDIYKCPFYRRRSTVKDSKTEL